MRFAIFIFISTSLALLIPRCDNGYGEFDNLIVDTSSDALLVDHASSSIDARDPAKVKHNVKSPYTQLWHDSSIETPTGTSAEIPTETPTETPTTTPLATRAVTTPDTKLSTSSCTPHSICVDAINSCGKRYGGPYPIPACPTMTTVKRAVAAPPAITPA
ncbi:unnamed protein product, partial [Aureobasidium mustum]